MSENIIEYKIIDIKKETNNVFTLCLSCVDALPRYNAGQIITVYIPELNKNKGKEYSISSEPSEEILNITVKRVGDFSKFITDKKVGDILFGSSPFGYFYSEKEDVDVVFIAGGIGIAPLRSMLVEYLRDDKKRNIDLFYSNKTLQDIVFKDELDRLCLEYKNIFNVHYYLTKENIVGQNIRSGRIPIDDILKAKRTKTAEFFICGSREFVQSYYNLLISAGIPYSNIFTEEFF